MTEKKTTTRTPKKLVIVYKGQTYKFDKNEFLPYDFVESKLREGQNYVPVWIYRELMRQIGEFGDVNFSEPQVVAEAKTSNGGSRLYKIDCEVEWKKEKRILKGSGYHAISFKSMISEAAHGNFKTLEAKALRDALKYAYKVFEFPSEEEVYYDEMLEKENEKMKEIIDKVKDKTETKKVKEIKEEVKDEVKEKSVDDKVEDIVENIIKKDTKKAEEDIIEVVRKKLKERLGDGGANAEVFEVAKKIKEELLNEYGDDVFVKYKTELNKLILSFVK